MQITGDKFMAEGWESFERRCSAQETSAITEHAYGLVRSRDNSGPCAPTAEEWLNAAQHVVGRVHTPGVATRGNIIINTVGGAIPNGVIPTCVREKTQSAR